MTVFLRGDVEIFSFVKGPPGDILSGALFFWACCVVFPFLGCMFILGGGFVRGA